MCSTVKTKLTITLLIFSHLFTLSSSSELDLRLFFGSVVSTEEISLVNSAYEYNAPSRTHDDSESAFGAFEAASFGDPVTSLMQEIDDAWSLAFKAEKDYKNVDEGKRKRSLSTTSHVFSSVLAQSMSSLSPHFPFLLCIKDSSKLSGYKRLLNLSNQLVAYSGDKKFLKVTGSDFGRKIELVGTNSPIYPIYNNDEQSCFAFRSEASTVRSMAFSLNETIREKLGEDVSVIPYTFSMKIESGTLEEISNRVSSSSNIFLEDVNIGTIPPIELNVKLSPGSGDGTETAGNEYAKSVMENSRYIALLADGFINFLTRTGHRNLKRSSLRGDNNNNDNDSNSTEYKSPVYALFDTIEKNNQHNRKRKLAETNCRNVFVDIEEYAHSFGDSFTLKLPINLQIDLETTTRCVNLLVAAITYQPEVLSLSAVPFLSGNNHIAKAIVQGATNEEFLPFHDAGIFGKDQVVAVSDTGLDIDNCYFKDASSEVLPKNGFVDTNKRKVVQYIPSSGKHVGYKSDDYNGHGTHVSATIAGRKAEDGLNETDGLYDGVAPASKLAFMDISIGGSHLSPPSDPIKLFSTGRSAGAKIHSCSWGAKVGFKKYSYYSKSFDEYLYLNQDFLVVIASGNYGYAGVAWPGTAKNVITVGATDNGYGDIRNKLAWFSGQGIVEGGRTKPDIVAPGSYTFSAVAGGACDEVYPMQGTSMSAPVVTGALALARQYFAEGKYYPDITEPSASLLKAIILNGGQQINGIPYDAKQNFGLVSLIDSLPLPPYNNITAKLFNLETIQDGESFSFNVTIDRSNNSTCAAPLSATLVWADLASSGSLINDLDLLIEGPITNSSSNNSSSTMKFFPNGRNERDTKNNAERVRINSAQDSEIYNITVSASNLIQSEIQYALVVTGCFLD